MSDTPLLRETRGTDSNSALKPVLFYDLQEREQTNPTATISTGPCELNSLVRIWHKYIAIEMLPSF